MGRKPKFKPMITRIKLNPEQAVLTCNCFNAGFRLYRTSIKTSIADVSGCDNARIRAGNSCDDGDSLYSGATGHWSGTLGSS